MIGMIQVQNIMLGHIRPSWQGSPDGASKDSFGRTVGIYGNTVIIGAHDDGANGDDSGLTLVFIRNGVTWMPHVIQIKRGYS